MSIKDKLYKQKLGRELLEKESRGPSTDLYYCDITTGKVTKADNIIEWAKWFENGSNRVLANTAFNDNTIVSTVFLGIPHGKDSKRKPILWETAVIDTITDKVTITVRYSSFEDALNGHVRVLSSLRSGELF